MRSVTKLPLHERERVYYQTTTFQTELDPQLRERPLVATDILRLLKEGGKASLSHAQSLKVKAWKICLDTLPAVWST